MFREKKIIVISGQKVSNLLISGRVQFMAVLLFVAMLARILVWIPFSTGRTLALIDDNTDVVELYESLNQRVEVLEDDIGKISHNLIEIKRYEDFITTKVDDGQMALIPTVDQLFKRITFLEDIRNQIAVNALHKVDTDVEVLENVISMAGTSYGRLTGKQAPGIDWSPTDGVGGPYDSANAKDLLTVESQKMIQQRIGYLNDLKNIVYFLPIAMPMSDDGLRMTSKFGIRRDPFKGTLAKHNGQDFVNRRDKAVRATAPGVVRRAVYAGGYGKLVEIDHGYEYSTRYAHLASMNVKKGDKVNRGDVIGIMGNTGRSTGAHLHYEIRKGRVPINPKPFIEAGKYVVFKAKESAKQVAKK